MLTLPALTISQPAREAPIELRVGVSADDEIGCELSISCATSSSGVIR
jgi:hypothetical protein